MNEIPFAQYTSITFLATFKCSTYQYFTIQPQSFIWPLYYVCKVSICHA